MKNLTVLLAVLVLAGYSCKTKPKSQTQIQTQEKTADAKSGPTKIAVKTQGNVSHEYRATGCSTVVVVKTEDAANLLILIPITALAKEFDKDGLTIFFNYRLSRIKNPEGCSHGIPAILTDISLK
jgi:outer membrane PBP1 activator LpoA protein